MANNNQKSTGILGLMPSSMSHLLAAIVIMLVGVPLTLDAKHTDLIHGFLFSIVYITLLLAFPRVILEANSAGVPVVASDIGGCREAGGDSARYQSPKAIILGVVIYLIG